MQIGDNVKIVIDEPWDGGVVKSKIVEEKDGILMFYTEQPITVGDVQTKRFYGKKRHAEDTGVYNYFCFLDVEDYTIDDVKEFERIAKEKNDWSNWKFFMSGSVERD